MNAELQSIPLSRSRDQFSQILMAHNHFHLFRTHDKYDATLSKDIVTGYQGPHLHIALSFYIHWGGSPVVSLPDGIIHVPWMQLLLELSQFCALAKQILFLNQAQLTSHSWRTDLSIECWQFFP
jgi:hypothetical protein